MKKSILLLFLYFSLILKNFSVSLENARSSFELKNKQDRIYEAVNPKSSKFEIAITGTFDEVQKYFEKKNWSDGITITPPKTKIENIFCLLLIKEIKY